MQTIVFATDFSEASENAYRYCLELASRMHTRIYVTHIYRHKKSVAMNEEQRQRLHQQEFEEFRRRTVRFSRLYPDTTNHNLLAHCLVTTDIEEGNASTKLLELAAQHQADVLILGAKRHPGLFKKLFGQVSQRLIYSHTCPVLIVPETYNVGFPKHVGVLCLEKSDEAYLTDWIGTVEMFSRFAVAYFLMYDNPDPAGPPQQPDVRRYVSRDASTLMERLDEAKVDLFIIKSKGESDDRKSLIHFLYDHLDYPLVCVP